MTVRDDLRHVGDHPASPDTTPDLPDEIAHAALRALGGFDRRARAPWIAALYPETADPSPGRPLEHSVAALWRERHDPAWRPCSTPVVDVSPRLRAARARGVDLSAVMRESAARSGE